MAETTAPPFRHETDRLILRDWRDGDGDAFLRHTNTPVVMRWLGGVMDETMGERIVARLAGFPADYGFGFWVVERKDDGGDLSDEVLGFCGLKRVDFENGPVGEFEIGWRLREDAWGKGYAREAAQATLALAFERFDAPLVVALTVIGNRPSWGLMERLGMERRADLDFHVRLSEAWDEDVIVYSLTRKQWESQS